MHKKRIFSHFFKKSEGKVFIFVLLSTTLNRVILFFEKKKKESLLFCKKEKTATIYSQIRGIICYNIINVTKTNL